MLSVSSNDSRAAAILPILHSFLQRLPFCPSNHSVNIVRILHGSPTTLARLLYHPIPPNLWMAAAESSSNTIGHRDTPPIDQAFVNMKYQPYKETEVEGWAPYNPVYCL